MVRSAYVALYKAVMNINEDGCRPHGWHGFDGDRCIKRDTLTERTFRFGEEIKNTTEKAKYDKFGIRKAVKLIQTINDKIDALKQKLLKISLYQVQGAMLRSKVRWHQYGEKI